MKAMLIKNTGPVSPTSLKEADIPDPEPGVGEIRIRIEACGVCRTDLHIVEGDLPLPKLPLIPGHQVVGTVKALGERMVRFNAKLCVKSF